MSQITYFQRYSQKENVVTNNTLLLLKNYYDYNITLFNEIIQKIFDNDDIKFGIEIQNQFKQNKNDSIPDAIIKQIPIKILVETKIKAQDFKQEQLENHCKGDRGVTDSSFLLCLASEDSWGFTNIEEINNYKV